MYPQVTHSNPSTQIYIQVPCITPLQKTYSYVKTDSKRAKTQAVLSCYNSPSPTRGGSGPVFSKLMTTPLWTFWTRDSRHWFNILWESTQYDRPESKQDVLLHTTGRNINSHQNDYDDQIKTTTSSDFTHLSDGRLVRGDTPELLRFWSGRSWQPQDERKQTLVPSERLFGQFTAGQRRVQRQV